MGRSDLGLSEPEFWALTPRLYRALLDRQRERVRAENDAANLRAGVIAAAVSNVFGGKKNGGAFSAKDFFNFDVQRTVASPRDSKAPKPPEAQAAIEAGWHAWMSVATAAAKRKGLTAA